VLSARDPSLDAWRGAAAYANGLFEKQEAYASSVDRATYEEVGVNRIFM